MSLGRIYIDMDDTTADFGGAEVFGEIIDDTKMYQPGFFRDLKPIDGALVAVRKLIKLGFDVQILTQPVAQSPHSYSEKVQWIGMWLPELLDKINMVQDKGQVVGEFLIDDNLSKWKDKFETNGGRFIHFPYKRFSTSHKASWENIVRFFEEVALDKKRKER
jgi:5'-nucleotidase